MSDPNAPAPPGAAEVPFEYDDQLQFDQAEYSTPAPRQAGAACTSCHRPIVDAYFETGGKVVCATCRQRIEEAFRGGSRMARGMRALLLGMLAAIAGAVVYYVIMRLTGYNIGIIAVVVGLMVGGGVRAGSGHRGGRFYQVLALFLTYTAIAGMHLPFVAEGFARNWQQELAQNQGPANKPQPNGPAANPRPQVPASAAEDQPPGGDIPPRQNQVAVNPQTKRDLASTEPKLAETKPAQAADEPPNIAILVVAPAIFLVVVFISPVLVAVQAPISGLIYCFALWEAWKINKKVELIFNGPFRVSAAPGGDLAPEAVGNGI